MKGIEKSPTQSKHEFNIFTPYIAKPWLIQAENYYKITTGQEKYFNNKSGREVFVIKQH